MKVLFVYPDIRVEDGCIGKTAQGSYDKLGGMFYIGLAYLSAVLKQNGHQTQLVHLTNTKDFLEKVSTAIDTWRPDIIAYSATTNMFSFVCEISHYVKDKYQVKQILGGGLMQRLTLKMP